MSSRRNPPFNRMSLNLINWGPRSIRHRCKTLPGSVLFRGVPSALPPPYKAPFLRLRGCLRCRCVPKTAFASPLAPNNNQLGGDTWSTLLFLLVYVGHRGGRHADRQTQTIKIERTTGQQDRQRPLQSCKASKALVSPCALFFKVPCR
jgi:hypothetical protein